MIKIDNLKKDLCLHVLRTEKIAKLDKEKKQEIVNYLSKQGKTVREIAKDLGVSHSVVVDWKTLRRDDMPTNRQSLSSIHSRLKRIDPKTFKDWGRLILIKELIEDLLRQNPNEKVIKQ